MATKQANTLPYPAPFILSSVERDQSRLGAWTVPDVKRKHLEANLLTFAGEIGMNEAERKKFLDYWCSPSNFDSNVIRAELDRCFNLRQRAESWMEKAAKTTTSRQPKSRLEQYAESAQQFYQNAKTIPTSPVGTQGFGYADIPDEQ